MRANVISGNFLQGLVPVAAASDRRSPIQILSHVRLHASQDGTISLFGTDLTLSCTTRTKARVESPGEIAIPSETILKLFKTFGGGEDILLELEHHDLNVTFQGGKVSIKCVSASDFPNLNSSKPKKASFWISSEVLSEMASSVVFITKTFDKKNLSSHGALVDFDDDRLTFAATDLHRLSVATVSSEKMTEYEGERKFNVVIPASAVQSLVNLPHGDTHVTVVDDVISFENAVSTMHARILNETFPDYRSVIKSQKRGHAFEIESSEALSAMKRATLLGDEKNIISITTGSDTLTVNVRSQRGDAQQSIRCSGEDIEEKITISFNGEYLTQYLDSVTPETVSLLIAGPSQAVLFDRKTSDNGVSYDYIVMPLRA